MLTDLKLQRDRLEAEIARLRGAQQITQKAWWVTGIWGDYVEFGAFRGDSLIQAYYSAFQVYQEMVFGARLEAFKGMVGTLLGNPTMRVLFEFDPQELAHPGCRPQKLLDSLISEGSKFSRWSKPASAWYGYTNLDRHSAIPRRNLSP